MKQRLTENGHHQEEIRRILDHKPPWIIRWGIAIISLLLVILIAMAFLFRLTDRFSQLF